MIYNSCPQNYSIIQDIHPTKTLQILPLFLGSIATFLLKRYPNEKCLFPQSNIRYQTPHINPIPAYHRWLLLQKIPREKRVTDTPLAMQCNARKRNSNNNETPFINHHTGIHRYTYHLNSPMGYHLCKACLPITQVTHENSSSSP